MTNKYKNQNIPALVKNSSNPNTLSSHNTSHPSRVVDVPSDMTAATLAALARRKMGRDHPAASLRAMNEKLHALMIEEGNREAMLYRQSSVLDAMFHDLISDAIGDKVNESEVIEESNVPAVPSYDSDILVAALKTQSLCVETIKTIHHISYLSALKDHLGAQSQISINNKRQCSGENKGTPLPPFFSEQTDEIGIDE